MNKSNRVIIGLLIIALAILIPALILSYFEKIYSLILSITGCLIFLINMVFILTIKVKDLCNKKDENAYKRKLEVTGLISSFSGCFCHICAFMFNVLSRFYYPELFDKLWSCFSCVGYLGLIISFVISHKLDKFNQWERANNEIKDDVFEEFN